MGDTLTDLRDHLRYHLVDLKSIRATFFTVSMDPAKIHVWTLLDRRDEETGDKLAVVEVGLMRAFPRITFDFSTIHLNGRDPFQFIPEGALPVEVPDRQLLDHMIRALRNPASHAKP